MIYFLPEGYCERSTPSPFGDSEGAVEWQPDVYAEAERLARSFGASAIVDVGCGMARKLLPLSADFMVVGVDHPSMIVRLEGRPGVWVGADLDSSSRPAIPDRLLDGAIVVCSDVIEHMVSPEVLCGHLRWMLESAVVCVLSTPDRDRTHGAGHFGPPPNPAHVREWAADELVLFLESQGFVVLRQGWTRSHTGTSDEATVLVMLAGANVGEDWSEQ